jgi:cold shock CspA family protein
MQIDTEKIYTGKIIYWNSEFGFLESPELSISVFLHSKTISDEIAKKISLFDLLNFKIGISTSPRNKGKLFARSVKYKEKGKIIEYPRKIGTIYDWNGRFGFINYPTDGKKIFLYYTRLLYSKEIHNGQLVVFNPINSNKDNSQLFAYFAYPITFEKDFNFIKEQYFNFEIPELKDYINQVSKNYPELTVSEKFELELLNIGNISTGQEYLKLTEIIKSFKTKFNYIPDCKLLSVFISDTYLIQLWETELISSYNVEKIKEYFISANADTKRLIALKVSIEDRELIILEYFNFLQKSRKIERLNNDIKTLLSIVYRNLETRLPNLYERIKSELISVLEPIEIIDLWLHDFIDDLTENFIISNFNIGDFKSVKLLTQKKAENGQPKYKALLSKIYEQYFLEVAKKENLDFDKEYPKLIRYLQIFEKEFSERFPDIINIIKATLRPYQKFVLWIFGINIEFDAITYLQNSQNGINHYFKIKFILRLLDTNKDFDFTQLLEQISINQTDLADFSTNYQWNDLIYPTKRIGIEDETSFLTDIVRFNENFRQSFDIYFIADKIYNSIELYNEIHLRLWLYNFNSNYDYVGFRECFKSLTNEEQKLFRQKANETNIEEITEQEITEVLPCLRFEANSDNSLTYFAFLENLYFGNGFIKLRKEDGKYTDPFNEPYSSTGLNRIPSSHSLNFVPLQIIVNSNIIQKTQGLNELFIQIHTGEISKALGKVVEPSDYPEKQNKAYVEDWVLRKSVIDFLNENQVENIKTTIVNEPKNHYRRLDDSSGIDMLEKTELFTIETSDGYGIIWENIDLSEDRATYIFKSSVENHKIQIQKIANAIVSFAQFRSTLSSARDEEFLTIFKNNFGFISSIRKQRGKNKPFSNWLSKLETALKQPIIELPTFEDLEKINNWSPEIPHVARVNKTQQYNYKKSTIIKGSELETTDFFEKETVTKQTIKQETFENSDKAVIIRNVEKRKSLLNSLKSFNQYFTENLNIN